MVSSDRPAGSRTGRKVSSNSDLILVFDGGALGNPGKGYGSFTYKGVAIRWPTRIDIPGRTTNNQAEYLALIAGLRSIRFDCEHLGLCVSDTRIEIFSDSNLVVNQISGSWKIKNQILRALHREALDELDHFESWSIDWHPRSESVRILGH